MSTPDALTRSRFPRCHPRCESASKVRETSGSAALVCCPPGWSPPPGKRKGRTNCPRAPDWGALERLGASLACVGDYTSDRDDRPPRAARTRRVQCVPAIRIETFVVDPGRVAAPELQQATVLASARAQHVAGPHRRRCRPGTRSLRSGYRSRLVRHHLHVTVPMPNGVASETRSGSRKLPSSSL